MNGAFIRELKRLLGPAAVLAEPASRLVYSYDAALDKALPGAVILPENTAGVAAAVRLAAREGVPFVARGAGTNLCGGSIPADGGLVIHLARLNRILELDPVARRAAVEPGVVNLNLQRAAAAHGLFYAPDPASQKACTLGGNVGTNAGGPHCLKLGVTTHHVRGLEMVLPDGETIRTSVEDPGIDLTGLFVGSEGTLGIATRIEVGLLPLPEEVVTSLVSFPSIEAAVQTVTDVIAAGIVPTTLELMDRLTVAAVEDFIGAGYPRDAEAVLLVELDGDRDRVERDQKEVEVLCRQNGAGEIRRARDAREREKLWEGRRGAYPAMARLAPNVLVEDGAVPRSRLPEAVRRVRAVAEREKIRLGLIAHAGDGNLHPNMIFDERDPEEARKVKSAGYEMLKICVDLGGSISGEHGIGTDKREAMKWLFTPETLACFRRIKSSFDPANLCNPDKLIPRAGSASPDSPAAAPLPDRGEITVESAEHLRGLLKSAADRRREIYVKGSGTKKFPFPPKPTVLVLSGMNRVVEHARSDFTLTVEAGITLRHVREFLAPFDQFVHLAGAGTVGGVLAARASRRPPARDQVLGMKVALAGGEIVQFGGRVMKNVAGYDAAKLFIGSWGTLGVILEVTLRLFPFPPPEPEAFSAPPSFEWFRNPACRRVKNAFDPLNVLNPSVFQETAEPLAATS